MCFSEKVKFRCHNCNQPNHKARDCKVKAPSLNKGAFNRKSLACFKAEHVMNVQNRFDSSQKISWCLVSGSTSHMCAQKSNFTELNKVKGGTK